MTRPAPLTDPDSDLTAFRDMPLEVQRFAQSDLVAFSSAEAVLAALMLWGAAWHSRPAGSLTNDDRALMRAAGFGRGADAAWHHVKDEALRGWIECSDGRLYHPVVAEKVRDSWAARLKHKHRTYLAAIRVHNSRNSDDPREGLSFDDWLANGRPEGAKRATPREKQEILDLPENEARRVTGDDVARNKVNGNANGHDVFAEKTLQGKGREGKGLESSLFNNRESPADLRKREIDPFDVTRIADELARRAGVPHSQPTHVARNLDMVRQWTGDGIDLAIVEEQIDKFRMDKPDQRVATLSFFDAGVRAKVAAKAAKDRKGHTPALTSTIAAPPVQALRATDDDDDRVRVIRSKLGNPDWLAPDRVALSIPDAETVLATVRSEFVRSRLDRNALARIVGEVMGDADVEVAVQR